MLNQTIYIPPCIDLILTNSLRIFQNTCVFETGLSDFHKMTVTVMKLHFPKQKPKIICYRDCKRFRNQIFRSELDNGLLKHDICNKVSTFFKQRFLDKHEQVKKKVYQSKPKQFL